MLIQEVFINKTEGYTIGNDGPYKSFTDNTGELFLSLQREYGRCVSRQYVDPDAKPIGWVFQKKMRYEDAKTNKPTDYYVLEVWVTLLDEPDMITTKRHYHYL